MTKAKIEILKKDRQTSFLKSTELNEKRKVAEEALQIVNSVLRETQSILKVFIEEICTLALQAVFGPLYSFSIEYQLKRNQSEAVLKIKKGGIELNFDDDDCSGGAIDTVAFALRVALWALTYPKPEPLLFLDEPGRNVSVDKQEAFTEMMATIIKQFGNLQAIVISHIEDIIENADTSFRVVQINNTSKVERI